MNLEKYDDVFVNLFEIEREELNSDFKFGESEGWDSFAHMQLIAELEDAFDIMLDTEDITHFGGYENGKIILSKYGVEF